MRVYIRWVFVFLCGVLPLQAQQTIEPMLCEGPLPADLQKSISDIISNEQSSDFTRQNLLGIYEIFSSGNVVFGNAAWKMVDRIGRKIIRENHLDTHVQFYLLRSGFYNAFATDQGYIFATTGLLSQVSNEDELAFVLCHELSHYLLNHNLKQHKKAKEGLLAMRKKRKKKADRSRFKTLDNFLKEYYEFSRVHELEADSLGLLLFRNAGYEQSNALHAISKLQFSSPLFYAHRYDHSLLEPGADTNFFRRFSASCRLRENLKSISILPLAFEEEDSSPVSMMAVNDSLYISHPDWRLRKERLENMMKGDGSLRKNLVHAIPPDVVFQCLSESFLHEIRNRNYLRATGYLLVMEQKFGPSEPLRQWKGICLSAVYFKYFEKSEKIYISNAVLADSQSFISDMLVHMLAWSREDFKSLAMYYNGSAVPDAPAGKISGFYMHKLGENFRPGQHPVRRDSLRLKDCNGSETSYSLNRPFFEYLNSYHENRDTNLAFTAWEKPVSRLYYNGKPAGSEKKKKQNTAQPAGKDTILMLSPYLMVQPSRPNHKFRDPLYHSDRKEFLASELLKWGSDQQLHYKDINFDNKAHLSTGVYNQYFVSILILSDLALAEEHETYCPLSVLYTGKIIRETGCSKLQMVQVLHKNNKSFLNAGTVFFELYTFPFSMVSFTDIGALTGSVYRNTLTINIVVDLINTRLDFVAIYENGLILSYDAISANAMRIQSDTVQFLSHE